VIGLVRIGRWHDASELARLKSRSSGEVELATRTPANPKVIIFDQQTAAIEQRVTGTKWVAILPVQPEQSRRATTSDLIHPSLRVSKKGAWAVR